MQTKSHAKVNIFLKIYGKQNNYHLLASRFCLVKSLFDTISFEKKQTKEFQLNGNFSCKLEQNTVYKIAQLLISKYPKASEFFEEFSINIDKKIQEFAGLGGGSSNAAAVLNFVNTYMNLGITKNELALIGKTVGADIPFFIYNYNSANVSGIGEIVEEFCENELDIEVFTPQIKCDTAMIFKEFRTNFYTEISDEEKNKLFALPSKEIISRLSINEANVLFAPAQKLHPDLNSYAKQGWFFSGSGSSFFKLKG